MAKLNLKVGAKLEVLAEVNGEEVELKSSYAGESGGKYRIATPMASGKSVSLAPGTKVALVWMADSGRYSVNAAVIGPVKQGVRTYLALDVADQVDRSERRVYQRVAAELDVELISFTTDRDGRRAEVISKGKTTDLSNGGAALVTNATLAVGETITVVIARRGTKKIHLKADVCWTRPAPRGLGFRDAVGVQFIYLTPEEGLEVAKLTASLAAKQ